MARTTVFLQQSLSAATIACVLCSATATVAQHTPTLGVMFTTAEGSASGSFTLPLTSTEPGDRPACWSLAQAVEFYASDLDAAPLLTLDGACALARTRGTGSQTVSLYFSAFAGPQDLTVMLFSAWSDFGVVERPVGQARAEYTVTDLEPWNSAHLVPPPDREAMAFLYYNRDQLFGELLSVELTADVHSSASASDCSGNVFRPIDENITALKAVAHFTLTAHDWGEGTAELEVRPGLGDLNCDGAVSFGDINPFIDALADPAEYHELYPHCEDLHGDLDQSGAVDFGDINLFVDLLIGLQD